MPFASLTIEMKPGVHPNNVSTLQEVENNNYSSLRASSPGALAVVVHYTSIGVKSCPGGTPLYGLFRVVPLDKAVFLPRCLLKGIRFCASLS